MSHVGYVVLDMALYLGAVLLMDQRGYHGRHQQAADNDICARMRVQSSPMRVCLLVEFEFCKVQAIFHFLDKKVPI